MLATPMLTEPNACTALGLRHTHSIHCCGSSPSSSELPSELLEAMEGSNDIDAVARRDPKTLNPKNPKPYVTNCGLTRRGAAGRLGEEAAVDPGADGCRRRSPWCRGVGPCPIRPPIGGQVGLDSLHLSGTNQPGRKQRGQVTMTVLQTHKCVPSEAQHTDALLVAQLPSAQL